MVTGVNPSGVNNSLAAEARVRPQLTLPQKPIGAESGERVSVSDAASLWRGAGDSVQAGIAALDLALAGGRQAVQNLNDIADAVRAGGDVQGAIDAYQDGLKAANSPLLQGEDIAVTAEPGAAPLTISSADLSLDGPLVRVPAHAADMAGAALSRAAIDGAASVQGVLTRLDSAARGLDAHAGFVDAAARAIGARTDLDADGARLMALQVRQGLDGVDGLSIANAQPQTVLSLFKA